MSRRKRRKPSPTPTASHPSVPPWEDGDSPSFGRWLSKQREVRNLTLRQVSDATKIGMRYLEALEDDRFDVLPATIFAKGFLRNYAQYVGLDADEVVNYFLVAERQQKGEVEEEEPDDAFHQSGSGIPMWVAIALGSLVVLLVVYVVLSQRRASALGSAAEPPAEASTSRSSGTGPSDAPSVAPAAVRTQPGDLASSPSRPMPIEREAATLESTNGAESSAPLRVVLSFTGDCWVEARVDGRRQISELRVQGESVQYEAEDSVSLVLGDIGAVQVEVNGEPYGSEERREGRVELTLRAQEFTVAERSDARSAWRDLAPANARVENGRPRVAAGAARD